VSNNTVSNTIGTSTVSFPISTILTIVFVVLKLTHTIDWSWWWVLCPIWFSAALVAFILLGVFLGFIVYYLVTKK
jgi:hypothetical protein